MKISLSHIREYQKLYNWSGDPAPDGLDALVTKIGAQLGAVEEVVLYGKRFEGVVVVKVVSCMAHPNSDHLHVCKIDDGGKVQDVERDEQGHVQVVCGAPNVREGLTVAWLPPGVTVPETYTTNPFVLEKRAIRGQLSNGMLASARELSLGDNHEGILEIDETITPGTPFVEAYNLVGDAVIDMENKMFTHRPDCFGMMGLAREIAGIEHQAFTSPDWYRTDAAVATADGPLQVEVRNEIPELVPRFVTVPMNNVSVRPSPVWMQIALSRLGVRPINNVVDITNYIMLLTGQPLHAYDYDKVKALSGGDHPVIVIRKAQAGEKLTLLGGKQIEPRSEAIMIATDTQAIGLGGVMGGGDTEVDEHTQNIIIEIANFDMYSIRRTAMEHGLFTDAVTRFTKGQSPLQNLAVMAKTVGDMGELAGAHIAGPLVDDNHVPQEILERGSIHPPVNVSAQFINERLGWQLPADEIKTLLTNVEFAVAVQGEELTVTAPFWRTDIEIAEDVVEEVGRLYGYDHLPLDLPKRDLTPAPKDFMLELKASLRAKLAAAGANEVLNYSFVHGNLLDKVGQSRDAAYQLANALSPDLQYYRVSLTPSLLEKVHPNIKAGYDQFALFELNKIHCKGVTDPNDGDLPQEDLHVALVFAAGDKAAAAVYEGAPYYQAKRYLETVLPSAAARLVPLAGFDFGDNGWGRQMCAPYEPNRSAVVVKDNLAWGVVGEFRPGVRKALKLPAYTAGFEVALDLIQKSSRQTYQALPRFPAVTQDICLKVPTQVTYGELESFVASHLDTNRPDQTRHTLEPLDIYQRADDAAHKQITFRVKLASFARTLTDDEVNQLLDGVAAAAAQTFQAERV